MPRQPRKASNTGIYHVMLRGIDGRGIFLDKEDKSIFLEKLKIIKSKVCFELYGYCLMGNHVHLLMQESEAIGDTIKRVAVGYVQWHNNKYARTGHLFQNRFRSEAVETDIYIKTVLRYIHRNPVKAKMVKEVGDYTYSSYGDYILSYENKETWIDTEFLKKHFKGYEDFKIFMGQVNDDNCLEENDINKYSDKELKEIIRSKYGDQDILLSFTRDKRNELIANIHNETKISIRQLSRVTGFSKKVIELALKSGTGLP